MTIENNVMRIAETVLREKKLIKEFVSLNNYLDNADEGEKKLISGQIEKTKAEFKKINDELLRSIEAINIERPLKREIIPVPEIPEAKKTEKKISTSALEKTGKMSEMEREVLKRLRKKKEKVEKKKEEKPSPYVRMANNFFAEYVKKIVKEKRLAVLEKDLIKSNLNYTSITYISMLILTTIFSAIASVFIFLFFLFFSISAELPIIIPATGEFGVRILQTFWIILIFPIGTFMFMYFYPSLEKKALEAKINQEIPFATINMAAISGSGIEPAKVFSIIVSTKEYPNLEKEFNKLLNKINIYGYDLVTALKDSATNCPSQKLSEIFNGLVTTITSGGDFFEFFDKRAQSLLFEYRLDKEKKTKSSETFMDIYISVVIAAPMILMLLLMMMRISGLGLALSTGTITFLVVGAVSSVNVLFLIFLQLKQPENL
ncbi:MAG: type II secretion system F family protein [Candidatus Nanoarchaeia archaeon]|nr:type II secretion system F family protein [Candidatus Nanoarchaeia archaeon]MDD5357690.1 type II secretion system F family protein [Candidatus Nanoarchaeia archaeon]MDD5588609.1 type II secretion system F family protein [Candidatus Nanoarchaeia archaeon]